MACELEPNPPLARWEEGTTSAEEYRTDPQLDGVNEVGIEETAKQLATTAQPDILALFRSERGSGCEAIIGHHRNLREVTWTKRARENVGP